ncbi:FAD-dependent oxidoreductase [Georgenia sp. SYP-B2076]|uniref:FAD-dependent oxidoreductase n=1 Tax=Georgenia sp. SYP-B2076 TaxID=2495881 RepID=UPI000F8EEC4D|nr:FAD-dependent oxidoreductase [Georgenia sp. SYP-B2076]
MLPGTAESYWMRTTPTTAYPQLTEDLEVDVAVIGAGIAGMSAAWELAAAWRSVALLEAGRIVAGVTGHTTAKLSALHGLNYARIRAAFGPDGARLYAQSQQDAVEHAASVSAELGIDCDLERLPGFTYVEAEDGLGEIREEVDAAAEAGLDVSFVTATGLPFPVAGAIRMEDQAQFHPRKYLLGLAEDLVRRGGRIFERTRATELDEGDPCRVTTEQGRVVTVRDVVVATHYPVFDQATIYSGMAPKREFAVAWPIPAEHDPHGISLTREQDIRSVRTAPYDDGRRLLIVTGEHYRPGAGRTTARYERLTAWTRGHFPVAEIACWWATQDHSTPDHVPYVGPFHPEAKHLWVATGFGGWGMSTGVMAGQLLTASIAGEELEWARLYDPRRLHEPRRATPTVKTEPRPAARSTPAAGDGDGAGDGERPPVAVDDVAAGTGAVLTLDGGDCAVYRDEDGAAYVLSARCTHLGCTVGFNDAEVAWECPCHGSRFAVDGTVIQGPATRPLPHMEPTVA